MYIDIYVYIYIYVACGRRDGPETPAASSTTPTHFGRSRTRDRIEVRAWGTSKPWARQRIIMNFRVEGPSYRIEGHVLCDSTFGIDCLMESKRRGGWTQNKFMFHEGRPWQPPMDSLPMGRRKPANRSCSPRSCSTGTCTARAPGPERRQQREVTC